MTPELVTLIGTDAYIDAHAAVFDNVLPGLGLGDLLRNLYYAAKQAIVDHVLCDCAIDGAYHCRNCPATPIWAQTIRDLDIDNYGSHT